MSRNPSGPIVPGGLLQTWRPGESTAAGTALLPETYKDREADRDHQAAGTPHWWVESGCHRTVCECSPLDLEGESDLCLSGFDSAGGDQIKTFLLAVFLFLEKNGILPDTRRCHSSSGRKAQSFWSSQNPESGCGLGEAGRGALLRMLEVVLQKREISDEVVVQDWKLRKGGGGRRRSSVADSGEGGLLGAEGGEEIVPGPD